MSDRTVHLFRKIKFNAGNEIESNLAYCLLKIRRSELVRLATVCPRCLRWLNALTLVQDSVKF